MLRVPLAVCLLPLLTFLPPTVESQSSPPPADAPLVTDPTGDVVAMVAGQAVPAQPTDAWKAMDLLWLRVIEDPDRFGFDLAVVDLGPDGPSQDWGTLDLAFTFRGTEFWIRLYRSFDNAAYFGQLLVDGHYLHDVPAMRDLATGQIGTSVDRRDLVAKDGRTPVQGDLLEGITVRSSASVGYTVSTDDSRATWIGDAMPDGAADGEAASWTVLHRGSAGSGARLSSPQPFRASNGEATTYQVPVQAAFEGTESTRFRLAAERVPAGWTVRLPGDLVDLPAGKPVSFDVLLTVPFAHVHGLTQAFVLRLDEDGSGGSGGAKGREGKAWATLEIGVHYTTVPQPAGHHPELFLHSLQWSGTAAAVNPAIGSSTGELFMNTRAEDAADNGVPIEGAASIGSQDAVYRWTVCLSPSLAIGLDFDLQGSGALRLPVKSTRPLAGAVLEGRLLRLDPGPALHDCLASNFADRPSVVIATMVSGPAALGAGSQSLLEAALVPTLQADYVPFQDGTALVLEIVLRAQGPGIGGLAGVSLLPGGSVSLPLLEYHDAVAALRGGNGTGAPAPDFVVAPEQAKESPSAPAGLLLAVLAALALALRRR